MATERSRRRTAGGAEIVERILERIRGARNLDFRNYKRHLAAEIAALKANSGDSHGKHPRG
jgi:hypothetical protein